MFNPCRNDFFSLPVASKASLWRFRSSIVVTSRVRISVVLTLPCLDLNYPETTYIKYSRHARVGGCCTSSPKRGQCGSVLCGFFSLSCLPVKPILPRWRTKSSFLSCSSLLFATCCSAELWVQPKCIARVLSLHTYYKRVTLEPPRFAAHLPTVRCVTIMLACVSATNQDQLFFLPEFHVCLFCLSFKNLCLSVIKASLII